ncbi:hypothetical protein MPTK1_5g14980 [Marchantia polymorpha subsp. ruderalis]|uniref:Uncharacterized protein n=2 Tax=Marchantia polymorpha TaxID=3197 RepID=A0AAF6BIH8_MARPO|nr:hypothetical protein MARPO_0071s0113 [Marchantia polymorpha]BBN11812.1 hypothetical protein Mp_5g14980 [Marchantia polymorpha subsp. ruderalis]|eukprot:PTQ35511.1 hypothetical protein MARPO_0071s0113 [Marchantia polymorpha]
MLRGQNQQPPPPHPPPQPPPQPPPPPPESPPPPPPIPPPVVAKATDPPIIGAPVPELCAPELCAPRDESLQMQMQMHAMRMNSAPPPNNINNGTQIKPSMMRNGEV